MPRPIIYLFPGQSSRDPEMFTRLASLSEQAARGAHAAIRSGLGHDLAFAFTSNQDIQLAVFAANQAYRTLLNDAGLEALASAGLSLGEYNHLVEIGALDGAAAVDLVAKRGAAYDAGPEGVMAALQPLAAEDAEELLGELHELHGWPLGEIALSNDNSPSQCVVAGSTAAVDTFIEAAAERFFAMATIIEQRAPMHSPRFAPVLNSFGAALDQAPLQRANKTYWPNVTAKPLNQAEGTDIRALLRRHVTECVRWRQTIDALDKQYSEAVFVEVGPRTILGNMLTRRWLPRERVVSVDDGRSTFPEILIKIGDLCGRA